MFFQPKSTDDRSIGDFDLKSAGVIAEPDVVRISIKHGKDKVLVLMTGLNFLVRLPKIVITSCRVVWC